MKNLIEVEDMIDNKTQLLAAATNITAGATVTNGLYHYINENATVITVSVGVIGLILTFIFGFLNSREHKRKTDIMLAQLKLNQEEAERERLKEDKIIITDEQLKK